MTAPRRLQLRRGNSTAISTYTGAAGEVVIDTTNWILYVHDGSTVGGYATTTNVASITGNITQANLGLKGYVDLANTIQSQQISAANLGMKGYVDSVASQSIYGNSNVKSYLTSGFDGNILPSANVTYSLGSPTRQWRDLFVSNTTIYLGGIPLSIDASGTLLVNGNVVQGAGGTTYSNVNVAAYLTTEGYAKTSDITTANLGLKGYVDQANTIQSAQISAANIGMKGYVDSQSFYSNSKVATYLAAGPLTISNVTISDNYGSQWRFTDTELQFPSGNGSPYGLGPRISSGGAGFQVYTNPDGDFMIQTYATVGGSRQYTFKPNGNINLSDGGNIVSDYRIGIYSEETVSVATLNGGTWTFGSDGKFTLPDGTASLEYSSDILFIDPGTDKAVVVGDAGGLVYWTFNSLTGNIIFPDASQQATAWTGTVDYTNVTNTPAVYGNIEVSTYLSDSTPKTFGSNVTIQGNLFVNGNVSYISVNNVVISDNIINLADLNPADSLDLGISAHRTVGITLEHTGFVRDASDNQWKLFSNITAQPGTTVDFTDAVYDAIRVGAITSPTIDAINNNIIAANTAMAFANTIQSEAITTANTGMKGYVDSQIFYSNARVATYLQHGNPSNISVAGNITATYFIGNGSQLTGLSSSYSNIQVAAYLATATINTTGNITAGNLITSGALYVANITTTGASGNISGANYITANFFIGNGSQLTGLPAGYSNVQVATYLPTYTGNIANIRLGVSGVLTFPDGTTQSTAGGGGGSNYGNGNVASYLITNGYINTNSAYGNSNVTAYTVSMGFTNFSNVNVAAYTTTQGFTNYSNVNVAAYLPSHTGNVGVNTLLGTTPNVVLTAGSYSSTFDTLGNVVLPSAYVTGNVLGQYILGNGAFLTGVVTGSSYSNVQVATYLPTYTGVVTASNVAVNGNVTAQYLFGNGSQLTGLPSTYSNVQVAAYLNATGYNLYSNANVASYLPLYGGDISARDITVSGNIQLTGNILQINAAVFYGNTLTGFEALYAGIPGYTPIPQVIAQFTADFNGYAQINSQNLGTGNQATSDFIATANNGTDSAYFVDFGIAGSGYDPGVAANNNAIGTALTPNDAYLYTAGNTAANPGGNLVIGVQTLNKNIRFFAGGVNANNVVLTIQGNGITTAGNVTGTYFIGNGSQLSGLSTYSNVQTKAYAETMGYQNYGNVNVKAYTEAMGFANYGDSNVASYLNTYSGNISAGYFIGDGSQLTGLSIPVTYSNVNVKAYTESMGFQNYGNVNVAAYLNASGYNLYSNVNVAAYLSTASITTTGNITAQNISGNISITGNVTGTSANVTLQAGSFSSTFDNQGNVRLPSAYVTANVTANYFVGNGALLTGIVAGSSYSNVQVATYLPTYTGVITASNVAVNGNVTAQFLFGNGSQLTGLPATYSNVNVATYLPTYSGNIANVRLGVSGVLTFADGTTQTTAGGGSYSNVQVATYLPTYTGNIANIRLGVSGVLTFADGTTMTSASAGTYSNVQVATYLPTHTGSINASNILVTGANITLANIQATTAATNTATGALRVMGGVGVAGSLFAGQLNTTGNLVANTVSVYGINVVANILASSVRAGTINSTGNVLAQSIIGTIATASQPSITEIGILTTLSVTGNATVGNLIGTEANTRIIANVYTTTFDIYGNVSFPGNVNVSGLGVVMPARPAFRAYGGATAFFQTSANVNLKGETLTVDYNQGNYANTVTGQFVAPVAGLYQTTLVARVANNNALNQMAVLKNGNLSGANVICFWETDTNTGVATHFGTSGVAKLAVGDYLSANIIAGNINFDSNDSWTVTYIG